MNPSFISWVSVNIFSQTLALEKGMAAHSSILACRIAWTDRAAWWTAARGVTQWDTTEVTERTLAWLFILLTLSFTEWTFFI